MDSSLKTTGFPSQKSVALLKPPILIGTLLFSTAALITGIWAFTAKIPEKVTGLGILQPVESVFRVKANGEGFLLYPFYEKEGKTQYGIPHWSDDAFAFVQDPTKLADDKLFDLASIILSDLQRFSTLRVDLQTYSGSRDSGNSHQLQVDNDDVIAIVDNPAQKADLYAKYSTLQDAIASYRKQLEIQNIVQQSQNTVTNAQAAMIPPLEKGFREGAISKKELNEQISTAASAQSQAAQNAAQIKELQRNVEKAQGDVRTALAAFVRRSLIFPPGQTEIVNFLNQQWTEVNDGDHLMTLKWKKQVSPNTIPVFLQAKQSTEITLGMEVILTPAGFNPAEIGGIKGNISSFNEAFLSQNDIAKVMGSEGYGQLVSPQGGAFITHVTLKREDHEKLTQLQSKARDSINNRGGYVWNNRSNPPVAPREGFILNAQIITRHRTPISMLIPALRTISGEAMPSRLIDLQNNLTK